MSDVNYDALLHHVLRNPKAQDRAQAAFLLGKHVDELDEEQYQTAMIALNQALNDADPRVVMEAMTALTQFTRHADEGWGAPADVDPDQVPPAKRARSCAVCGKPEPLIDPETCEFDNCPFR
jgi:hypothetical protein